jgi:hypothetical protein
MEIISAAWIAVFFLFLLVLIFAWSKILIIAGRVRNLQTMADSIESPEVKNTVDTPNKG